MHVVVRKTVRLMGETFRSDDCKGKYTSEAQT